MSFKVLLSTVLLFASAQVYASSSVKLSTAAPSVQDQLNYIMLVAPKQGKRSEFQNMTNYYFQKGTSFDTTQERDVQYLSVIGAEDVNKEFYPQVLSTVTESWKKADAGAWEITQQIREVNLSGQVYKSLSKRLVIDASGILKTNETLPSPSQADDQAAFEKEVAGWYAELKK